MFPQECKSSHHALVRAISAGRPRQVGMMLEAGANPDERDECGKTPLIHAVFVDDPKSRHKIVKTLLNKGAAVSTADATGRNALSWACMQGKDREVDLLLQYSDPNLDLNHNDVSGRTALFHAATSGSAASVKLMVDSLIERGMSVDVADFNGVTPLMQTLSLGFDVCATILVKQGKASTTVADSNFLSAFDWAKPSHGSPVPHTHLPAITESPGNVTEWRRGSGLCRMCTSITETEFDSCYGSESSYCEDGLLDLDTRRRSQSFSDDDIFDLASLSLADFSPKRRRSSQDSGSESMHDGLPPINRRPGSAVRRPKPHIRRNTVSGRLGNIRESADHDDVFFDDDDCHSALSDQTEMRRQHGFPMISEGRFSLASRADGSTKPLTALRAQIDKLL
ncbi:neurogenic locus notch homolog protein 4-like [Acanthaster planci]|uniref:Neurogenic locus notch homolog protein 4-like n=1 Tax=Acanthaster planci TaxID=133434 RepID=A0A8B7XJX9_ACAPL|nr:neurogenic locus notch homolog protein 4-like [Acanthaster planci]